MLKKRVDATRNYCCNSKVLASVFKERVIKQLNMSVFKLQEFKYNMHVGKIK